MRTRAVKCAVLQLATVGAEDELSHHIKRTNAHTHTLTLTQTYSLTHTHLGSLSISCDVLKSFYHLVYYFTAFFYTCIYFKLPGVYLVIIIILSPFQTPGFVTFCVTTATLLLVVALTVAVVVVVT